jgi:peptidoglycan/LPS O-acetylase OafA/YrhL
MNGLSKPAATFDDRIQATRGRSSGFDYTRVLLAIAIIVSHGMMTSYGAAKQDLVTAHFWARPIWLMVPMFFSLSGFLVAGSWERCRTMVSFLGLRVLRIFPALTAQVVLSALIIGPILTTYTLHAYFHDPLFVQFLWNAVGHTQYLLPGVFTHNPDQAVNGQLWTVPFELDCYLALTALALVGVVRRRWMLLAGLIGVQALLAVHAVRTTHPPTMSLSGELAALCFMWGLALYRFRDRVPASGRLALLCLVLAYVGLMIPNGKYFITLPIAYFTNYIGLLNPPRDRFLMSGDYSYGLYVFSYPVQQVIASYPQMRIWWLNDLIALPISLAIAFVSWHLLEKRALGLRGRLVNLEGWILALWRRLPWPKRPTRATMEAPPAAAPSPALTLESGEMPAG